MLLITEGDTRWQEDEAAGVLNLLCAAYPGHPWAVRAAGGVIFIRHLEMPNGTWGMSVKFGAVNHDAAVLKREVIRMAGEWLERSGLKRGRSNEDEIVRVEGISDRWQKPETKPPLVLTETAPTPGAHEPTGIPERTTPRPQALKGWKARK